MQLARVVQCATFRNMLIQYNEELLDSFDFQSR